MDTNKLRQKILDLAIHGKLVPQDPNDEPASVLLEKLKAEKERLIKEGKIKRTKKSAKASDTPHYQQGVPFEVPSNWVWCKIEDIGEVITGNTPSKDRVEYYGGDIPFFKPADLEQGIDTKYASDHLSELGFEQSRKLPANTILVTCIGATIGKTGIITVAGSCNQQINAIVPYKEVTHSFIFYVCVSDYMQSEIISNASATTLPILNKGNFANLLFPLPPIAEQYCIVKEIERWFALIDQIEQDKSDLQTVIKQTKSKILDLAIRGKLVPQDPNDEPASELLKRINPKAEITCDNGHYPQLPAGWAICRLEDIVKYEQPQAYIVSSTNYDDSYTTPVLTAGKSFIIGYTEDMDGIYTKLPCIIFDDFTTDSRLVDFPFKVKSSAMKILQVVKGIEIEYVAMFMSITRLISDTHKRYWISEYSKLYIAIPPIEEQRRIINTTKSMFEKLDAIMESL